jgi:glucosyl-3-phosphoglycerate synthase
MNNPEHSSAWFETATSHWTDWDLERLLSAKRDQRVSLVIPARNEAATVGDIVTAIRRALIEQPPPVDDLVMIDSESTDDTARIAATAGVGVWKAAAAPRPRQPCRKGRGAVECTACHGGDVLLFTDANLGDPIEQTP